VVREQLDGQLFLYLYGRGAGRDEGTLHIAGNFFYDYWMGTALNPRIRSFDFKFFCESRPGLIMWVAGDLSLAAKQYQLHGRVTVAMILVCAFHVWYIVDYFFHEEAILRPSVVGSGPRSRSLEPVGASLGS